MGEPCERVDKDGNRICDTPTIKGGTKPLNGKLYCQYHYNRITMGLEDE